MRNDLVAWLVGGVCVAAFITGLVVLIYSAIQAHTDVTLACIQRGGVMIQGNCSWSRLTIDEGGFPR